MQNFFVGNLGRYEGKYKQNSGSMVNLSIDEHCLLRESMIKALCKLQKSFRRFNY